MTDYSAIILAGGRSSRMGQKKAMLQLQGKPFIEIIIDKLAQAGMGEILISGYEYSDPRVKYVEDRYFNKGPLAGIHAGLCSAAGRHVFVIPEDAPLVPVSFIKQLMEEHERCAAPITAASCEGRIQQLVGIYDKSLAPECEEILQEDKGSVMALIDMVGCSTVSYPGDAIYIKGCNTLEEYRRMLL